MRESDIEQYLVKRVKAMGGEVRKVKWIGRAKAPDRVVMLPPYERTGTPPDGPRDYWKEPARTIWIEVKHPDKVHLFPSNAHERAQHREHERMRKMGQRVEVVGTFADVDRILEN